MIEVLDKKTSVAATKKDDEFVVQQSTTVKVEDEVDLSPVAEAVVEAVEEKQETPLKKLLSIATDRS